MTDNIKTVVIGAGVLGLTSALRLQEALGRQGTVLIVARDWPADESINYASPWAGAHGRWIPIVTKADLQHQALSRITYAVLKDLAASEPNSGVEFMDGYEFHAHPSEAYVNLEGEYANHENFRVLEPKEFPTEMGISFGCKYKTWSLNPSVYIAYLLRKFLLRGGKTLRRTLVSAEEAFSLAKDVDVVVNCSGIGFGDPDTYPMRGQTCLVANPCDRTISQFNVDGSFSFIIPRPLEGGTIIGGTKEPNDWESKPREDTRREILAKIAKIYPPILNPNGKFDIIRDIVGRRPGRTSGLRLEIEDMKKESLRGKRIIHAYGAQGSGFALSWGVAKEVLKMVMGDGAETVKASI